VVLSIYSGADSEVLARLTVDPAVDLDDSAAAAAEEAELDRVLARNDVRSVYQPIVELDTGAVVGYEALARGPGGSVLQSPDTLFAAARRAGRLVELDRVCQFAAAGGARAAGMHTSWTLFINVEPEAAHATIGAPVLDPGGGLGPDSLDCQVVVEFTERDLIGDPTTLLAMVARIRDRGWGIALDDVGAHPDSLALLPLLQPDVIKLDLSLVQQRPSAQIAAIVSAVNAEAETSGSAILAEGIETEEHRGIALAMGASLGQGWLLGRPGPLPDPLPDFTGTAVAVNSSGGRAPTQSPFALGAARRPVRLSRKELLIEMSKHIEAQALHAGESAVVLATFQDSRFFTPQTRERYLRLAQQAGFVGALGANMPAVPMPGVRGCVLDPSDPLIGEWDLVVVGPHYAAVLVARDLGDTGPDRQRRFEFVLSHDRRLAIQVALALMTRVWPLP
jgi:EAL domain-containing protein (putative c-di-GMP-specific phosphodiesterase class I)